MVPYYLGVKLVEEELQLAPTSNLIVIGVLNL